MKGSYHPRGERMALAGAVMRGELPLEAALASKELTPSQLMDWLRERGESTPPSLEDLRPSTLDQRLRQLRRQVRRLQAHLSSLRAQRQQILALLAGIDAGAPAPGLSPRAGAIPPRQIGDVAPVQPAAPRHEVISLTARGYRS